MSERGVIGTAHSNSEEFACPVHGASSYAVSVTKAEPGGPFWSAYYCEECAVQAILRLLPLRVDDPKGAMPRAFDETGERERKFLAAALKLAAVADPMKSGQMVKEALEHFQAMAREYRGMEPE